MRINFIIKETRGKKSVIDGETYYGQLNVVDGRLMSLGRERELLAMGLEDEVSYRLPDYWMPRDLIRTFNLDAIDFARETTAADPERASDVVIPIAAHVKVCTVQLGSESFEEAMNRAIRAEDLVPLFVWSFRAVVDESKCSCERGFNLSYRLEGKRFESVDEALALMPLCSICSQAPTFGTQITVLPKCGHAFHSRCIILHLVDQDMCPCCSTPACVEKYPILADLL